MASNTPEFPGPQWGDTVEIPARKRRRINKYQGFLLEEKEFLMKCEHLESRTKKILKASHEKLSSFVSQQNLPDEIKYLNNHVSKLTEKISLDPIYIGLFGSTGAGKTSLLNAILEKPFFLPVSGSAVCTSCVVQIYTSWAEFCEAKIHLLSDEENLWKDWTHAADVRGTRTQENQTGMEMHVSGPSSRKWK
ncbi:nuclear GTPase SLIP-GC-like isoform X2 [Alligator mississippiensis]|uniref:nuclear GTPase SLIP-GC-like isoform X2 n=1 Tax=Alligator mississippiensis TaxID=8496 RepID=UPI0028779A1E|nr:nuclear GTPase SLIP-GC-like isoform X2 [Alligator mississippiensis]